MKKNIIFLMGLLCAVESLDGQILPNPLVQPVSWKYSTKQVNDSTYELHLAAIIQPGWHIYAQDQPEDAICIPTTIHIMSNSQIVLRGKPLEIGDKEKFENKAVGISDWQYEREVDFVQMVHAKNRDAVRVSGSILYQACKNEECLKPVKTTFRLLLNESS